MRRFNLLIVVAIAAIVLGAKLYRHLGDPIRADEAAWIFSTAYLTHYLGGDWGHADWGALDAMDHPPVAKYYFGIATRITGKTWKDAGDKAWWLGHSGDVLGADAFRAGIEGRVPAAVLRACRIENALAAFAAVLGLYALGCWLFGRAVGSFTAIFFVMSRLVLHYVPIIEPDFLLIAICMWQAAFLVRWMGSADWRCALAAAVLAGIAIDTKLTGFIQIPVTIAAMAFVIASARNRKKAVIQSICIMAGLVGVAVILNPTLFSPLEAVPRMLEHRWIQAAARAHFSGMAYISPILPAIKGWQHIFTDFGLVVDSIWFPFGLLFSTIGFVALACRTCGREREAGNGALMVVAVMAVLWSGISIWSFSRTLWLRYLLPISPFLALSMAYGAAFMWNNVVRTRGLALNRIILLGTAFFLALWLGPTRVDVEGCLVRAMNVPHYQLEVLPN